MAVKSAFITNGCIMTADEAMDKIQKHLNRIKKEFLVPDYDDNKSGWIVEDHIHAIQDVINDYTNREFKASEPDPFN